MKRSRLFICFLGCSISSGCLTSAAPGVSSLGSGYLKGRAEAEERARQEKREDEQRAFALFQSLLEKGWTPAPEGACTYWFPSLGMGLNPPK